MKSQGSYSVKAFARLAGVTVRTLHYYDEIGLLPPSSSTPANHRLYQDADLLRLQQILTLKYLGFSLEEIRNLLTAPGYDLQHSLQIQKEAIDSRIQQLRAVSLALGDTLAWFFASEPGNLDLGLICQIIQGVKMEDKQQWTDKYYTPEQREWLQEHAKQFTPEQIAQSNQDWADLITAFKRYSDKSPDDPVFEPLAEKYDTLLSAFTGGNPGIQSSLNKMYQNLDEFPAEYRPFDRQTLEFIGKVMDTYHKRIR